MQKIILNRAIKPPILKPNHQTSPQRETSQLPETSLTLQISNMFSPLSSMTYYHPASTTQAVPVPQLPPQTTHPIPIFSLTPFQTNPSRCNYLPMLSQVLNETRSIQLEPGQSHQRHHIHGCISHDVQLKSGTHSSQLCSSSDNIFLTNCFLTPMSCM